MGDISGVVLQYPRDAIEIGAIGIGVIEKERHREVRCTISGR